MRECSESWYKKLAGNLAISQTTSENFFDAPDFQLSKCILPSRHFNLFCFCGQNTSKNIYIKSCQSFLFGFVLFQRTFLGYTNFIFHRVMFNFRNVLDFPLISLWKELGCFREMDVPAISGKAQFIFMKVWLRKLLLYFYTLETLLKL